MTQSYPYDGAAEATFIEPELPHLVARFADVVLVPSQRIGALRHVPGGVSRDDTLADRLAHGGRLGAYARAAASTACWREVRSLRPSARTAGGGRLIAQHFAIAAAIAKWLRRAVASRPEHPATCYTYWFTAPTTGAAFAKRSGAPVTVVTRAHRYDLYESRGMPFFPFRRLVLNTIDQVHVVSAHGRGHLLERFPGAKNVFVSRLGVGRPAARSSASTDGRFRVYSCSHFEPVKRVPLIAAALRELAANHPDRTIEWTHVGDGDQRRVVQADAQRASPSNLLMRFPGRVANDELLRQYGTSSVDVFVNLSASEGIPVSIMEAQSCGIPVIATDVGGVAEIINERVGTLLAADPSVADVARALATYLTTAAHEKRQASVANWEHHFDAAKNHARFAEMISSRSIAPSSTAN